MPSKVEFFRKLIKTEGLIGDEFDYVDASMASEIAEILAKKQDPGFRDRFYGQLIYQVEKFRERKKNKSKEQICSTN